MKETWTLEMILKINLEWAKERLVRISASPRDPKIKWAPRALIRSNTVVKRIGNVFKILNLELHLRFIAYDSIQTCSFTSHHPEIYTATPGGGEHLNVTWRGGAHFLRVSATRLGKKFAFWYPVSEFLDYKTMGKQ